MKIPTEEKQELKVAFAKAGVILLIIIVTAVITHLFS